MTNRRISLSVPLKISTLSCRAYRDARPVGDAAIKFAQRSRVYNSSLVFSLTGEALFLAVEHTHEVLVGLQIFLGKCNDCGTCSKPLISIEVSTDIETCARSDFFQNNFSFACAWILIARYTIRISDAVISHILRESHK